MKEIFNVWKKKILSKKDSQLSEEQDSQVSGAEPISTINKPVAEDVRHENHGLWIFELRPSESSISEIKDLNSLFILLLMRSLIMWQFILYLLNNKNSRILVYPKIENAHILTLDYQLASIRQVEEKLKKLSDALLVSSNQLDLTEFVDQFLNIPFSIAGINSDQKDLHVFEQAFGEDRLDNILQRLIAMRLHEAPFYSIFKNDNHIIKSSLMNFWKPVSIWINPEKDNVRDNTGNAVKSIHQKTQDTTQLTTRFLNCNIEQALRILNATKHIHYFSDLSYTGASAMRTNLLPAKEVRSKILDLINRSIHLQPSRAKLIQNRSNLQAADVWSCMIIFKLPENFFLLSVSDLLSADKAGIESNEQNKTESSLNTRLQFSNITEMIRKIRDKAGSNIFFINDSTFVMFPEISEAIHLLSFISTQLEQSQHNSTNNEWLKACSLDVILFFTSGELNQRLLIRKMFGCEIDSNTIRKTKNPIRHEHCQVNLTIMDNLGQLVCWRDSLKSLAMEILALSISRGVSDKTDLNRSNTKKEFINAVCTIIFRYGLDSEIDSELCLILRNEFARLAKGYDDKPEVIKMISLLNDWVRQISDLNQSIPDHNEKIRCNVVYNFFTLVSEVLNICRLKWLYTR